MVTVKQLRDGSLLPHCELYVSKSQWGGSCHRHCNVNLYVLLYLWSVFLQEQVTSAGRKQWCRAGGSRGLWH